MFTMWFAIGIMFFRLLIQTQMESEYKERVCKEWQLADWPWPEDALETTECPVPFFQLEELLSDMKCAMIC